MEIPKYLQIFGRRVRIQRKSLGVNHGEFDLDAMSIYLSDSLDGKELQTTLLHEIMHAALGIGGVSYAITDEQEEAVVRCLENGFLPVLQRLSYSTPRSRAPTKKRTKK